MDKKILEEYINKLKEMDKNLSDDESNEDFKFINELDNLLGQLTDELHDNVSKAGYFVEVKTKKLHPNAVIPTYSKLGDAGMDLTITSEIENTIFKVSYGFGIAMEIPKGYVGLIFPRSSVRKYDLILSNCVGVIDSGYRGEIQATFKKTNGVNSVKYEVGERGAQIIILPYPQVKIIETDILSETERGEGGFGSTGS
jgi:dUTP pyrophosphatase